MRGTGPLPTCRRGHAWTEGNTYLRTGPAGNLIRTCRECQRKRAMAYRGGTALPPPPSRKLERRP